MENNIDHSGEIHGRLTLLGKNGNKQEYWCSCSCGKYNKDNPKLIKYKDIAKGTTKSCGCYHLERSSKQMIEYNKSLIQRNNYDLSGEYGIGYTSNGGKFYFDLEDYEKIKDYTWWINSGYVVTKKDGFRIKMHNLICEKKEIDHFNRNKLDNRKNNLKVISHQENMFNKGEYSNNTSGAKGVAWCKTNNKWQAYIQAYKQRHHLGYFDSFEDAVKARKEAEEKYFGKFSYDNSIKSGDKYADIS